MKTHHHFQNLGGPSHRPLSEKKLVHKQTHLWDDNVRLTRTWSLLKNSAKDNLGSLMSLVSDRHHWDENRLNSQAQAWSRVICCTGNHPCLMSLSKNPPVLKRGGAVERAGDRKHDTL